MIKLVQDAAAPNSSERFYFFAYFLRGLSCVQYEEFYGTRRRISGRKWDGMEWRIKAEETTGIVVIFLAPSPLVNNLKEPFAVALQFDLANTGDG